MKFIYVDESGNPDQGDVFTMCGLMVDAYNIRKKTEDFDTLLENIFMLRDGDGRDFKTKKFIGGKRGWKKIPEDKRKEFLRDICKLAVGNGGKVFGIGLSFEAFNKAVGNGHEQPFNNNYWLASAMFTACLVQKKMQILKKRRGLTVIVMDDNKMEMPKISDGLYQGDPWFDGLYQTRGSKRREKFWLDRVKKDRFDHIINTAFSIKSDHSSIVQVADVLSYVYRRHLELQSVDKINASEKKYYTELVEILKPARIKLGQCPDTPCVKFYKAAKHSNWTL